MPYPSSAVRSHGTKKSTYTPTQAGAIALLAAWETASPGTTTSARKQLVDECYARLATAGDTATGYAKLDRLMIPAAHNTSVAPFDWVNPANFFQYLVSSAGFTADRGNAGQMDANFTPGATHFIRDSATFGIYFNTSKASAVATNHVTLASSINVSFDPRNASGNAVAQLNNTTAQTLAAFATDHLGLWTIIRANSGAFRWRRNNAAGGTVSVASTALSGTEFRFGNTDARTALWFAGSDLTNAEADALYAAFLPYLTALGAN